MSNRKSRGFTLIEMIIAIVILGVGLAGVLSAFSLVVKTSSDPLVHKQMLALAEEMMEEVTLKPFAGAGTISGCNRAAAGGIMDYAGYGPQSVCTIDGTVIDDSYKVAVAVAASAVGGIPAASARQITVTVTHGSETLSLTGWRVDYAGGLSS
jgi:MSHA pilin protein MshD